MSSPIQNVAVLGASGNLGEVIVPALVKAGFTVTAISRPGSTYAPPAGLAAAVQTKHAAYDDLPALTAALRGQDALVEAYNPAAGSQQRLIVRAALAAGVRHLITSEFGLDTFHPHGAQGVISETKVAAQAALAEELRGAEDRLAWTGIVTGAWYDWGIRNGKLWVDPSTRTVTRFGSGNQRVSMTCHERCGEAVVAVLRDPAKYRNRPVYVANHTVSTNEMIDMLREVAEDPDMPWKVAEVPDVDAFFNQGMAMWEEDTKQGVTDRLSTQAYVMVGTAVVFNEHNKYGADFGHKNEPGWDDGREKLKEDLKQLTTAART